MGIKEAYSKWKAGAPARDKARREAEARRASAAWQKQRRQIAMTEQKAKLLQQQASVERYTAEKRKHIQSFRPQRPAMSSGGMGGGFGMGSSPSSFSMQPSGIMSSSYFAPKVIAKPIAAPVKRRRRKVRRARRRKKR